MGDEDELYPTSARIGVEVYDLLVNDRALPFSQVGEMEVMALACYLLSLAESGKHDQYRARYWSIPGCVLIEVSEQMLNILLKEIQFISAKSFPIELWRDVINQIKGQQHEPDGFTATELADTMDSHELAEELRAMVREDRAVQTLKKKGDVV